MLVEEARADTPACDEPPAGWRETASARDEPAYSPTENPA